MNKRYKQPKFDILSIREVNGTDDETQKVIKIITTEDNVYPIGSFKYRVHRYPSDIDIMENIRACCDARTASKTIAQKIRSIAQEIKASKEIFLGDFKAGVDERYDINLGMVNDKGEIIDFNPKSVRVQLVDLYQKKLLTQTEFDQALSYTTRHINIDSFEELKEIIRNRYIIRWTLNDLIKGYKILPKGVKISLAEALRQDSVVKIDLWAPIENGYKEITNYFLIVAVDKNGEQTILNQKIGSRLFNLDEDIQKYSSPKHRNSLKLAKRLWSKAAFTNDVQLLEKLYPLFGSDAARLNQITSESEVIRAMLKKIKQPPYAIILKQIEGFKRRINDAALAIKVDTKPLYAIINNIIKPYKNTRKPPSKVLISDNLENLEHFLNQYIEQYSADYLKNNAIKF